MTSNAGSITTSDAESYMGNAVSNAVSTVNPFGFQSSATNATVGNPYAASSDTNPTAYGQYANESDPGGLSSGASYGSGDWFGPHAITGTDGSTTNLQYNALGEVSAKTIFVGTSHSVQYNYKCERHAIGHQQISLYRLSRQL